MTSHKTIAAALLALALFTACGNPERPTRAAPAASGTARNQEGHVALTEAAAKAAGIAILTAGSAPIGDVLSLYGTVQPNNERVVEITARFPGVIRSVNASVGDSVRQGQILATVESDESLRTYPVTATQDGIVTTRKANAGEKAGDLPLFTVADLTSVWVELSMFPRDLAKVHSGQKVRIRSVDGGPFSEGRIVNIAALGQATSQTLSARVLLANKDRNWVPGLYVTGEVSLSERTVALAVKNSALQLVDGRNVVFTFSSDGFQMRAVELGLADGDYTEIRAGLGQGDRYAAANSFVLKSELGKSEAGHED